MVSDDVLDLVHNDKASWLRGDIIAFDDSGTDIHSNKHSHGVPKGGPGREELTEVDIVIMATGYHRPSLNFLPPECFDEPYEPPNRYLQVF